MGLSKSTRIGILLGIDTAFFLLEITVGYTVHSLALIADAFHMLNDVISLLVGLWAVKIANRKSNRMYTYGWQRAETLGALVNGVFLVALCLTIFLEAIQRFFEPQEISNPKLVLIVGCAGLASNILGLALFHDHGHAHGGHDEHGDSHGEHNGLAAAEEGRNGAHIESDESTQVADESGNVADVLPHAQVAGWPRTQDGDSGRERSFSGTGSGPTVRNSDETGSTLPGSMYRTRSGSHRRTGRSGRGSWSRAPATEDDIRVHPAEFRSEIQRTARELDMETPTESECDEAAEDSAQATESSPLLQGTKSAKPSKHGIQDGQASWHVGHKHTKPKPEKSGGHSHDLNMKGVFLHVLGDALGNVGVIASALFIWLTTFSWRYYFDPLISLVITCIILGSAIPLCKAASRILLQAVPAGIDVEEIKHDIEQLPGIVSCHHVHVWQLSYTKLIASLHVQVDYDVKSEGSEKYMDIARAIRTCLHEYGIHSSTIQPEFLNSEHGMAQGRSDGNGTNKNYGYGGASYADVVRRQGSKPGSLQDGEGDACLLNCPDECGARNQCCDPQSDRAETDDEHSH
ncbi:cation efflux protein [Xylona heveae TC161]|uniref:Cation efflux protein n=1 Tax=Xylona heveae (strain CBS 132557 / TC161) TaxID=1328760 RepID=A0A165IS97_XYLHT|nr:cation efflux protein [Xylona heveae TC161]KZF25311.1 cation efflux protein [Xylona heveae TC161]